MTAALQACECSSTCCCDRRVRMSCFRRRPKMRLAFPTFVCRERHQGGHPCQSSHEQPNERLYTAHRRRPLRGRFQAKCLRFDSRSKKAPVISITAGMRQAIGGLMRRGEWSSAAEGSLALAGSLLKRGRPRDAKAAVEGARESCRKAQGDRLLIAEATLSGVALVDLGRLEEADTVLAAAQTVAAHSTDRSPLPAVSLALARCRFWRGQYADARDSLRLLLDRELTDGDRVRVGLMRARLSIAEDDIAAANGVVVETMECAERIARPGIVAEAASVAAFVHVAAGDLGAVRRDAAACATAARAARDPLRHLRTQLLLSELLRRGGARNEALRVFARCRRIPS